MVDSRKQSSEKVSADVAVKPNHLAEAIAKITGDLERTPEDVQNAIAHRILTTDSIDDVFAEMSSLSAEDVLGQPHKIKGIEFSKSRFEDGPPAFAVVTGEFSDGEKVYTIGAVTAIAQLVRMVDHLQKNGSAPFPVVVKQKDTPTAQGYYPMFYVKA